MSRRRPDWNELQESAAEIHGDDGGDPKRFFDRRTWCDESRRPPGRKARQLCEQVAEALRGILAGCADDSLRELEILRVEPAPNTTRLLVTVRTSAEAALTAEAIRRSAGYLRAGVAAAIVRRKVPELAFGIV